MCASVRRMIYRSRPRIDASKHQEWATTSTTKCRKGEKNVSSERFPKASDNSFRLVDCIYTIYNILYTYIYNIGTYKYKYIYIYSRIGILYRYIVRAP